MRNLITSTHTKITNYDDCKEYLPLTDVDPNNSNNIILFYTGSSISNDWDPNTSWNREHVWAQSIGWFKTSGAGADLHHIRPCSTSLNSSIGNDKFGESDGYFDPTNHPKITTGADYRGDVARIIFYLMTRYSESDSYGFSSVCESVEILLKWNKLDPVSDGEIYRNNYIYTIQGNRNPFIDNSNYANMIWG